MATNVYGQIAGYLGSKAVDLENDDIKVMLLDSTYTMDDNTDATVADLTGEITGTGYTSGGISLTGKTWQYVPADPFGMGAHWAFDADDITWTALTATFRQAVLYDNTHAAKPLIACVTWSANQSAANQDLTIKWEFSRGGSPAHSIFELGYN